MLPVSLDCPFLIALRFSLTFTCHVSCVSKMLPVSLYCPSLIVHSVFSSIYLLQTVLCLVCSMLPVSLYCQFLIFDSVFSKVYLLQTVLCLVHPMFSVSLYWPFLIAPSVFSNLYLSCVLYVQCCQCLCLIHSWLSIRLSLMFIYQKFC